MIIVAHRRNTRAELAAVPAKYGIEVDIRSQGNDLIIHHDPYVAGESFERWIEAYAHRLLILNVKEEGLEERLLDLMRRRGIEDFFFLDQSFPFLVKTVRKGERRTALRVSEYESIETPLAMRGMVDWIWVDCFTRLPLEERDAKRLVDAGFKLCLVSPELVGRTDPAEVADWRRLFAAWRIEPAAVCTKKPELWE